MSENGAGVSAPEWVPVDSVKLNPENPRENEGGVGTVARSLERYGWRQPIVANKRTGIIEAGNTRYKAAVRLGREEVWVAWADDDEQTALGYSLMDNRSRDLSEWNDAMLVEQLRELEALGSLDDSGFEAHDLEALAEQLRGAGPPEDFPEYDENIDTSRIRTVECPQCGHEFPV